MTNNIAPNQPALSLSERLWARVDKNGPTPVHRPELGPCWVWTGRIDHKGYGRISTVLYPKKTDPRTHRASFFVVHGRWQTLFLLHLCDNPACVKTASDEFGPTHLIEGTLKENNADMASKGRHGQQQKTHCPKGHPYDESNTYRKPSSPSKRLCLVCSREAYRKQNAKRRPKSA